jgi:hypothetical protein
LHFKLYCYFKPIEICWLSLGCRAIGTAPERTFLSKIAVTIRGTTGPCGFPIAMKGFDMTAGTVTGFNSPKASASFSLTTRDPIQLDVRKILAGIALP